jgi:glucose/arabinose dehydrogenase
MDKARISAAPVLTIAALLASCGQASGGENASPAATPPAASSAQGYEVSAHGKFDEPWALAFAPGTSVAFITERGGTIKFVDLPSGRQGTVTGMPQVNYGGQGGLGDIAFLPAEADDTLSRRTIYLSWAEAGSGNLSGAVVGRGTLVCGQADECSVEGLNVIWRQEPKVSGQGHYSHKIAVSPDGQYLFISSGDRQKQDPAQDLSNNLGSIVRLTLDDEPAPGNPYEGRSSPTDQIWSWGHRNTLGVAFDPQGRLWNLEHGPAGGDELNLIEKGRNYGWPLFSDGDNYNGTPIPDNQPGDDYVDPVVNWTPVIAPGDFIIYTGDAFPAWRGHALIAGLKTQALIDVAMNGTSAREVARYDFGERLRDIAQGPDGSVWIIEDGSSGRLLRLTPQ